VLAGRERKEGVGVDGTGLTEVPPAAIDEVADLLEVGLEVGEGFVEV
jgi:hypothetical protein